MAFHADQAHVRSIMEPQFELLLYNYKHYNAYTKHLQISTKIQREKAGNFPVESKSEQNRDAGKRHVKR